MPADKVNPEGQENHPARRRLRARRRRRRICHPGQRRRGPRRGRHRPSPPDAKYDTYVQHGSGFADPAVQLCLLNKKVELLNQKGTLLSQGRTDLPDTKAIDDQLAEH